MYILSYIWKIKDIEFDRLSMPRQAVIACNQHSNHDVMLVRLPTLPSPSFLRHHHCAQSNQKERRTDQENHNSGIVRIISN